MQIVFRLAYSLAVALLFVLFVVLGTRTFYEEPDYPLYSPFAEPVPPFGKSISCDQRVDVCYLDGQEITSQVESILTDTEREFLQSQRETAQRQRDFATEQEEYFRNIFIIASVLGIAAIGGGLYMYRRVEAMPLGLVLGGTGALIYGWAESAQGSDEAVGTPTLFAVVAVGLVVVLAAGYWVLGPRNTSAGDGD